MYYWVFIWTLSSEDVTFRNWGIQFLLSIIQEIFINQPLKIFVVHILVVCSIRPQLRQIFNVLMNASLLKIKSGLSDDEGASKKLTAYKDIRVVQHFSAACRAARKHHISHLPTSQLLMQLGDYELSLCREMRYSALSIFVVTLISIPAILAFASPQVQDVFLDIVIPAVWNTFLLVNALMLAVSPGLLVAPYLVLFLYMTYRLYLLRRVRRKYLRPTSKAHSSTRGWRGRGNKNSGSHSPDVLRFVDYFVLTLHNVLPKKKKSALSSTDLLWRNMNINVFLQGQARVSRAQNKSFPRNVASADGSPARAAINIPSEILSSKSVVVVDTLSDDTFMNKTVWRVQSVESQVCHVNAPSTEQPRPLSGFKQYMGSRWRDQRKDADSDLALKYAREIFLELDEGQSGFLEGAELNKLAHWTWKNLYFQKNLPSGDELDEVLERLLYAMDTDKEGRISLSSFTTWLSEACDDVIEDQNGKASVEPFQYRIA